MSVTMVVGLQWGDEAKGKVVDALAPEADVIARFNGGDNAGHTVVNEYGTFKFRLIPSGILNPSASVVIGNAVVVNLETLNQELESVAPFTDPGKKLWISPRCHVVMPYHRILDGLYEEAKGAASTGTTRRGMGPVYADKVSYNGIRLYDLLTPQQFKDKLSVQVRIKNAILRAFGHEELDGQQMYDQTMDLFEPVRHMVREPFGMLQDALQADANILIEGAQAALLDNDWGTYPFCTASSSLTGSITPGLGVAPKWITRSIGVAKAYIGRVGNGPMPTELTDETGDLIREAGNEYGTVTRRPRRVGWLDAEITRFTCQLNGIDELALAKLDVLDKLPKIKVGVGYRDRSGRTDLRYWDGDAHWLETIEPVYEELDGWNQSTKEARSFDALPEKAQDYVRFVEDVIGSPISIVSVGPEREAIFPVK
ncbi:MAG: adenylosuccinate synthase [Anaerolineales bacterium]|nr:adenylosuccinate synthase [Anaerolineales bacterium]